MSEIDRSRNALVAYCKFRNNYEKKQMKEFK